MQIVKRSLRKINHSVCILCARLSRFVYATRQSRFSNNQPVRLAMLISRPHDVDLLMDTYERSLQRGDVKIKVWATERSIRRFPDTVGKLAELAVNPDFTLTHRNLFMAIPKLLQMNALLNTVESTLAAHKVPYALTRMANAAGVQTYTLQHGIELAGLTYPEGIYGPEIRFAAQTVLSWWPLDKLPEAITRETRRKCIAVGYPKRYLVARNKPIHDSRGRPIIAVFEGLNSSVFDETFMARFFSDLEEMALRHPNFSFVLKPHPGCLERSRQHAEFLASLRGVEVLDPTRPATEQRTTLWLLSHALGVITTRSTIASDAALAGTPVAVIRYGQKIPHYFSITYPYYEPLPIIDRTQDWVNFLEALTTDSSELKRLGETFLSKMIFPGDAASRILDVVVDKARSG